MLHVPRNSVSTTIPVHPTYNPISYDITHVNVQESITSHPPMKEPDLSDQYTSEINNKYINVF
jgi:hypothetical protein